MNKTANSFKKLYKPFNPLFIHFFMIMNKNGFIKMDKNHLDRRRTKNPYTILNMTVLRNRERQQRGPSKHSETEIRKLKQQRKWQTEEQKCSWMLLPVIKHTNTWQPPLWHAWRWRRGGSGIRVVPHELDVRVHHFFNKLLLEYTHTHTHRLFLNPQCTGSEPLWFFTGTLTSNVTRGFQPMIFKALELSPCKKS